MVSFKNGILKLGADSDRASYKIIFEISFFITLVSIYMLNNVKSGLLVTVALMTFATAILLIGRSRKTFVFPIHTIWYFSFIILASLSTLWATYTSITNSYLDRMLVILLITFGIIQYVNSFDDLERMIDIFIYSVLVIMIVSLVTTPTDELFAKFWIGGIGGNNSNVTGYIAATAGGLCFYKAYLKEKPLFYIPYALFLFCAVLTSSRKALMMFILYTIMLTFFAVHKKGYIIRILIIVFLSVLAIVLILKVPALYDIIGLRFQSMFDFFSDEDTALHESSLTLRKYFIGIAKKHFYEHPIIGNGMWNFSLLLQKESATGLAVYSHNNYWELLCDLGIVGFVFYYWIYVYMLFKLLYLVIKKNQPVYILFFSVIVSQLIFEYGNVNISSYYPQIIIAMTFCSTYIFDDKRNYHYIKS